MALKGKRQVFVNEYVKCWNATQAARVAGYKHPGQQGHRLLKNVQIDEAIQKALSEGAMSAEEALFRLGQMARADAGQYHDEHGIIDWAALKRDGHLVKEISHFKGHSGFKLHDAQAALNTILKHHGALVNRHEHSGPGGGPIETKTDVTGIDKRFAEVMALLDSARTRSDADTSQADSQ